MNKDYQLWVLFEDGQYLGFTITHSYIENEERKLCFQYLAGEQLNKWMNKILVIQDMAKMDGHVEFKAWTRPGIARLLIEQFGWTRTVKTPRKWEVRKR